MASYAHSIVRVGGAALPDGVMMLTPKAAAIARADARGVLTVRSFPLPHRQSSAIDTVPFVRVLPKLVSQFKVVVHGWKRDRSTPYPLLGAIVVLGAVSGGLNWLLAAVPAPWYAIVVSLFQLILIVSVVALTRTIPRLGRIWRFHGGEHQAIAAYEAGLELSVENTATRSLYHPRCGTNLAALALLLMIPGMVLGTSISGAVGYLITVAVPLPALCVAFEIVMFGQNHLRPMLWPGLALQRVTVARPGPAESLVALAALNAALGEHTRMEAECHAATADSQTPEGAVVAATPDPVRA